MKIGLIINRFVSSGGGLERYTSRLAAELLAAGHQLHVFAREWDASTPDRNLSLHRVPVMRGMSFLRELSFALACKKLVAQHPCDLVFSLERTIQQDICRAGAGCHREWLAQRRRYLSSGRRWTLGCNPLHLTLLWLERRTFSPAHTRFVIANSHRGKEEIVRHYGFPKERIFVVHNGVNGDRFRPRSTARSTDEFTLLFVGTGFERKGLEYCIRVLAELPDRVRLRVAGRGNQARYQRLAQTLGVAARFQFLGDVGKIEELYAQGDLLLHPAIYEPFSNACLEAMACGLPVVTSRINGAAEVITQGKNGAIVEEPADIPALAQAIRPFLDSAMLASASVEARKTAEAMPFSMNVRQTLEIFSRIIAQTVR